MGAALNNPYQLSRLMNQGMLGGRSALGSMNNGLGIYGRDKPFGRNATHVAIAYFISADKSA
jgi:hypothetical protein